MKGFSKHEERQTRAQAEGGKGGPMAWANDIMLDALATITIERRAGRLAIAGMAILGLVAIVEAFIATRPCELLTPAPILRGHEWHPPVASFPARSGGTCRWDLPDGRSVYWSAAGEPYDEQRMCYWPPDAQPRMRVRLEEAQLP